MDLQSIHDHARKNNIPIMLDDGMKFLLEFIEKHTDIRDILEIGTAVGYSAICMAKIRWDNTVDTIEINPDLHVQADKNIRSFHLEERIHTYLMDAYVFQPQKVYDMIFIDAAKSQYRRYLEHFLPHIRKGGYMIFDNLAFHGIVDNEDLSQNRSTIQMARKIKKFREHLQNDKRFDVTYYENIGDGIAVAKVL